MVGQSLPLPSLDVLTGGMLYTCSVQLRLAEFSLGESAQVWHVQRTPPRAPLIYRITKPHNYIHSLIEALRLREEVPRLQLTSLVYYWPAQQVAS